MSLFPSLDNAPAESDDLSAQFQIGPMFGKLIEYGIPGILSKIENIDKLDEQEIKDIIFRQYHLILNYDLFLSSQREYAMKLFSNKRFLQILVSVAGALQLNREEIICINKLSYDYYQSGAVDIEIFELMMQVSNYINQRMITVLAPQLGSVRYSRILAMIAKSSFRDDRNAKRVHHFLMAYYNKDLSAKEIANIYIYLFEHFTLPFVETMLIIKTPNLQPHELVRFDRISEAMVILINSMSTPELTKMLYDYAFIIRMRGVKATRFSLKEVKAPAGNILIKRLHDVIDTIESDEIGDLEIP